MNQFSLILLPTLHCNVACDYCFEQKSGERLSLDRLAILTGKVLDYLVQKHLGQLTIYWQGGEVMTLPPAWYEAAYQCIGELAASRNIAIYHSFQSNMIDYNDDWNPVIAHMFGNNVGSSMDFPNLHRRTTGGNAQEYTTVWERNVHLAHEAGIEVQVIALPNQETLRLGAKRFYAYFVDQLQITNFQLNTPFPGGKSNAVKRDLLLDLDRLSCFYNDLAQIWMERGYHQGIRIGPFEELVRYFRGEDTCILCIWRENCTDEFLCIDARGAVAQCDCWVASYPEYWFGNIFESPTLSQLLEQSDVHRRFLGRPEKIIAQEDCLECDYLVLCHGGCPVRTYSISSHLFTKDPYCALYQSLFACMEDIAAQLAGNRASSVNKLL